MTEYQKLLDAEQHPEMGDVAITERETGQEGTACTYGNLVRVFYGAEDGSDDKAISIDQFNRQFMVTGYVNYDF